MSHHEQAGRQSDKNLKTCREPNGNGLRATAAHQQGTIDRQRPVVR